MKNLLKFLIAIFAICGIACTPQDGNENGNNLTDPNGPSNPSNPSDPSDPGLSDLVFNITVSDITATGAYVAVETTSKETYYFDVIEKDILDQYSDKSVFLAEMIADLKALYEEYGYTLADALSYGSDGYLYEEGCFEPNTDYYAFAVAVTENGVVNSDLTLKQFKTLEAAAGGGGSGSDESSNNSFAVTVSAITSSSATVAVVPSNSDTYYFDVIEKEILDYYTDKKEFAAEYIAELKAYLAEELGYTLDMILSSGSDAYAYEDSLEPNTDYYAFAVGVSSNGAITTDVAVKAFTTLASGSGNEGGNTGGSTSGDKDLTCFEMGYYENWGDYYESGATNWYIDLYSMTTNDYFVIELQGDLSETAPVAGEYKLLSTFAAGTAVAGGVDADGYGYGTYWALLDNNWEYFVETALCTSGTVKVTKNGDLYNIDVDAVGDSGQSIKLSYAGVLEEYISDYSLASQKLCNNLNKRFCTVSRMMKQKQVKMAPKAMLKNKAHSVVKLTPKKVAPKSAVVKRNIAR